MQSTFRDYSNVNQSVIDTYKEKHTNQTVYYSDKMIHKYCHNTSRKCIKMTIWDALLLSNTIIDQSDPDIHIEQIHHCFQVSEKLRQLYPDDEQLHLIGLIHDIGKILLLEQFGNLDQWSVVGDIYPVGCKFSKKIVYSEFFINNIDNYNSSYNNKYGIYRPNHGFKNMKFCWSHDEYLYNVLNSNKNCKLDPKYLNIIRYHSFYAFHKDNAYEYLADEQDMKLKPFLRIFSECDLYTKCDQKMDIGDLEMYYKTLIDKYLGGDFYW